MYSSLSHIVLKNSVQKATYHVQLLRFTASSSKESTSSAPKSISFTRNSKGSSETKNGEQVSAGATILNPSLSRKKLAILQNTLGISSNRLRSLTNKNLMLRETSLKHCEAVAKLLKDFNIMKTDSAEGILLFCAAPQTLQQNYLFLKECGVTSITASLLYGCSKLLNLSLPVFQLHTNINEITDVINGWISLLPPDFHAEITSLVNKDVDVERTPIKCIRSIIIGRYLSWKLNSTLEETHAASESLGFSCQTILNIVKNVEILLAINFTEEKILKNPVVLQGDYRHLDKLITTYPTFLGEEVKQFLWDNPFVCKFDFDTLQENHDILTHYKFPLSTLRRNLSLLAMDPWKLRETLIKLERYPELKVLWHNPNFPSILNNLETAGLRLEVLRSIDSRHVTFHNLHTCKDSEFVRIIQQGKSFRIPNEVLRYLEAHVDKTQEEIRLALMSHPHWNQLNVANMKEVIELLEQKKFTPSQIFNGLQLVLYPVAEVIAAMQEMQARPEHNQKLEVNASYPDVLQFLLYFIEHKYHFSGNQVFVYKPKHKPLGTKANVDCAKLTLDS